MEISFNYKGYPSVYKTDIGYRGKWTCRINNQFVDFKTPEYIMRTINTYEKALKLLEKEVYILDKDNLEIIKLKIDRIRIDGEDEWGWDGCRILTSDGKVMNKNTTYVEKDNLNLLQREIEIEKEGKVWKAERDKNFDKLYDANIMREFD